MATKLLVNNSADNGLKIEGTKLLPKPMLTRDYYHQSLRNFTTNTQGMLAKNIIWN